ncbi:MAG: Pyrrolo-quinoline quinone [Pedosphaera sp.]|nr:Pyrrolo-quinoline quinone [Pedosphaera sp.]
MHSGEPASSNMIPIKIQCGCGQRYAFEIEPVDSLTPNAVACPSCGIDGTDAANDFIAKNAGSQPVAVAAPAPATETRRGGAPAKQIDIIQVTHEARAKMMWGDEKDAVLKFLMLQGLPYQEAANLSQALFAERAATVRSNGISKLVTGIGLMCVPVVTYLGFRAMGFLPIKLLGLAGAVGVWGAYRVLKGAIMIISPKSEPGDVSEQ